MTLSYESGPAAEAFDVSLFRQWMKLSFTDDDALILSLAKSARCLIEAYSGLILFSQTWRLVLDHWPQDRFIPLKPRPFTRLLEASVAPATGAAVSVLSSLTYDFERQGLRVAASVLQPGSSSNGIQLRLIFGAETVDAVDPILRHALFNLVTQFYFNRGDEVKALIPASIRDELDQLRIRRLA